MVPRRSNPMMNALALLLAGGAITGAARADLLSISFEDYARGSINGKQGWGGRELAGGSREAIHKKLDQQVVKVDSGQAFRMSNKGRTGQPVGTFNHACSPALVEAAGEGSTGAALDRFEFSLDFRTVTDKADGSAIDLSIDNGKGQRLSNLSLRNASSGTGGGVELRAEYADPSGVIRSMTLAQGLARDSWHSLRVVADLNNGDANDVVRYLLDGSLIGEVPSWESFHASRGGTFAADRVLFRAPVQGSDLGFSVNSPKGFDFDNLVLSSSPQLVPSPAGAAALALGGLVIGLRRRR